MNMHAQTASTTELGQDIAARLGRIADLEARLVKAETRENMRRLAMGVGALFFSALFALVALGTFAAFVVLLLIDNGFSASASAGLVAGCTLVLSVAGGTWGVWLMRTSSIIPQRAVKALKGVLGALRDRHV